MITLGGIHYIVQQNENGSKERDSDIKTFFHV